MEVGSGGMQVELTDGGSGSTLFFVADGLLDGLFLSALQKTVDPSTWRMSVCPA
jgi:hypothetical protein